MAMLANRRHQLTAGDSWPVLANGVGFSFIPRTAVAKVVKKSI